MQSAINHQAQNNKFQRVACWKRHMRAQDSNRSAWLRSKHKHQVIKVTNTPAGPSACMQRRMGTIHQAWEKIYHAHKNGEPSLRQFMEQYGPVMRRAALDLPSITSEQLLAKVSRTKPSASGMDHWNSTELRSLFLWAQGAAAPLAQLLNLIERTGRWPSPCLQGRVVFIPKEVDSGFAEALNHRPITILSCTYRLWSGIRHDALSTFWLPKWVSGQVFGLKGHGSADELAFLTCQEIANAVLDNRTYGGVSYHLAKCYDHIPYRLAVSIMRHRGADSAVCRALDGFYAQHFRHFQLEGHYSKPFHASNGLIQGCCLSNLILASLVGAWQEFLGQQVPQVSCRSYADDLSITTSHHEPAQMREDVIQAHQHTRRFVDLTGGHINCDKSFSFGHQSLKGSVPSLPNHEQHFRLTGGTVKMSQKACWSQLEQSRATKWNRTVNTIRHLPVGWFTKVTCVQRAMPQLTFAQGTHQLHVGRDQVRHLRADVIRCLLDQDFYIASPWAVFALIAPPSLEPEFALQNAALSLLKRVLSSHCKAQAFRERLETSRDTCDGPYARAAQLNASSIYGPVVNDILQQRQFPPSRRHDLRERFRSKVWEVLSQDRPQHFAGCHNGIQRKLTISLITVWTHKADELQALIGAGFSDLPCPALDPRVRLKVLRLLLVGGLMSPEADHRHRRRAGQVSCKCGAVPTLYHISWECPLYQAQRLPALHALPAPLHVLPACFSHCTIVPAGFSIDNEQLHKLQSSLVSVWQSHIEDWTSSPDIAIVQPEPSVSEVPAPSPHPVARRGHILRPTSSGGMFCAKCGLQTKFIKHIRLKKLSKPCRNADLAEDQWLTQPGRMSGESRLNDLLAHLRGSLNNGGHILTWNRLVGKDPQDRNNYGEFDCFRCKRLWPWKVRHRPVFRNSICYLSTSNVQAPHWIPPSPAPKRRLKHKSRTPPAAAEALPQGERPTVNDNALPAISHELPSGSRDHPRRGVG